MPEKILVKVTVIFEAIMDDDYKKYTKGKRDLAQRVWRSIRNYINDLEWVRIEDEKVQLPHSKFLQKGTPHND